MKTKENTFNFIIFDKKYAHAQTLLRPIWGELEACRVRRSRHTVLACILCAQNDEINGSLHFSRCSGQSCFYMLMLATLYPAA